MLPHKWVFLCSNKLLGGFNVFFLITGFLCSLVYPLYILIAEAMLLFVYWQQSHFIRTPPSWLNHFVKNHTPHIITLVINLQGEEVCRVHIQTIPDVSSFLTLWEASGRIQTLYFLIFIITILVSPTCRDVFGSDPRSPVCLNLLFPGFCLFIHIDYCESLPSKHCFFL